MKKLIISFFSILIGSVTQASSAAGGVAPGFDYSHWNDRIHVFWISFLLMTGGSILYGILLRKKLKRDTNVG